MKSCTEQRIPEWYLARAGKITASDLWRVFSPAEKIRYKERLILERLLTQDKLLALVEQDKALKSGNPHIARGLALEGVAIEAYEKILGREIERVGFISPPGELAEWFGASPDGIIPGEAGVEVKCPTSRTYFSQHGRIPNRHLLQMYGGMIATGLKRWHYVTFVDGEIYPQVVDADEEKLSMIEAAIKALIAEIKSELDGMEV